MTSATAESTSTTSTVTVTASADTATDTPSATTSTPATTSSSPGVTSGTVAPRRLTTNDSEVYFVSPSGRISCRLDAADGGDVRCDQLGTPFAVPQEISDGCEFDTGTSMSASSSGPVIGCVSDVVGMQPATSKSSQSWWQESFGTAGSGNQAVLPYGSSISVGDVVCESTRTHVRCAVGDTGFTISGQGYSTF